MGKKSNADEIKKQTDILRLIIKSDWPESVVHPLCKSQEILLVHKEGNRNMLARKRYELHKFKISNILHNSKFSTKEANWTATEYAKKINCPFQNSKPKYKVQTDAQRQTEQHITKLSQRCQPNCPKISKDIKLSTSTKSCQKIWRKSGKYADEN